jgi:hypothetical protein
VRGRGEGGGGWDEEVANTMSTAEKQLHLAHWRQILAALTPHHSWYGGGAALERKSVLDAEECFYIVGDTLSERLDRLEVSATPPHLAQPPPPLQHHVYGTLDDMPPSATKNLESINAATCERLKEYHGVVFWGPISNDLPQNGYWGKKIVLDSNEALQMRFTPKDVFTDAEDRDFDQLPDVIFISSRIAHPCGRNEVHTAVLFKPGEVHIGEEVEMVDASNAMRLCACRGLHVVLAGLYKRHNFTISGVRAGMGMAAQDDKGHEAIRSSTYSIFERDRKDLHRANDHHNSSGASAGPSVLTIANEFRDQLLDLTGSRRCAEPITLRKFRDQLTETRRDLCPDGDTSAADSAIASAMACVELLSAEGLMGILANPFFDGALPDRLVGPHGTGLSLALACRLAINWSEYGLPKPSACDMYANDQFRMIWCTSGFPDLPMPDKGIWALDLVLKVGLQRAEEESDQLRDQVRDQSGGSSRPTETNIVNDHKVFWQRLGQGVITRLFGLGASPGACTSGSKPCSLGKAWRLKDPGQYTRDHTLTKLGVKWEGVDEPLIQLSPPGPRKTAFVRLILGVEKWLRSGEGPGAQTLSPKNADGPYSQTERHCIYVALLNKVVLPRLLQSSLTNGEGVVYATGQVLDTQMNYAAFEHASNSACILMVHGPMLHLTHNVGAYIVAPKQELTCTECDEKVHVLSGVMFSNTYSECTACHSKRCISCANTYSKAIDLVARVLQQRGTSGPTSVGRTCRKCGADPAKLSVRYVIGVDGQRSTDLHLSARERKVQPQVKTVELRGGEENAFVMQGDQLAPEAIKPEAIKSAGSGASRVAHARITTSNGSNLSVRSAKKRGARR